jgi:hypothetical protein
MVNDVTFCKEMYELRALITGSKSGSGSVLPNVSDNLILQYPESISNMNLSAGGSFVREVAINRRLISLTVSAPEGVTVVLSNNNETFLWFTGEAGNEKFPHGKLLGTLKIEVTNSGSEAARWLCRMVFD